MSISNESQKLSDEEVIKKMKCKRVELLQDIIGKFTKTEPKLTEKEIAFIIVWEFGDITGLLKDVEKEVKKEKLSKVVNQS